MAAPTPAPTCPICSEPIQPGDSVAFTDGDMVHVRCYTKDREERKQPPPVGQTR